MLRFNYIWCSRRALSGGAASGPRPRAAHSCGDAAAGSDRATPLTAAPPTGACRRATAAGPRPTSHRSMRERGENVSSVRKRCQQTSPSKITSAAFQWSFSKLTGLLCDVTCCVFEQNSKFDLTQWKNRVIFSFGSRATLSGSGCVWVTVPSTYMESGPWWSQCSILMRRNLWCPMVYGN